MLADPAAHRQFNSLSGALLPPLLPEILSQGKAPHVVAREVVEEARARWSEREGTVDDCTIVLMFLEPNPTYKGVGLRSNPIAMKRTSTTEVPHAAVVSAWGRRLGNQQFYADIVALFALQARIDTAPCPFPPKSLF